jgi:hypothetical protein
VTEHSVNDYMLIDILVNDDEKEEEVDSDVNGKF